MKNWRVLFAILITLVVLLHLALLQPSEAQGVGGYSVEASK